MHLALGITFEIIAFINAIFGIVIFSMYINSSPAKNKVTTQRQVTVTVTPNNNGTTNNGTTNNGTTNNNATPITRTNTITEESEKPNPNHSGAIFLLICALFLLALSFGSFGADVFMNSFYDYYEKPKSVLRGKHKGLTGGLFVLLAINYIGLFYYVYSPKGIKSTKLSDTHKRNINAMMAVSYVFLIYMAVIGVYFLVDKLSE